MAGDDQSHAVIQQHWNVGDVVDQQDLPAQDVEAQMIGDGCCPLCVDIIVASHDVQRGDGAELLDDVLAADVTGVDDLLAALKRRDGFGSEQPVGVGNHANFHAMPRIRAGWARSVTRCARPACCKRWAVAGFDPLGSVFTDLDHHLAECPSGQVLIGFASLLERVDVINHRANPVLVEKRIHPVKRRAGSYGDAAKGGLAEDHRHQVCAVPEPDRSCAAGAGVRVVVEGAFPEAASSLV